MPGDEAAVDLDAVDHEAAAGSGSRRGRCRSRRARSGSPAEARPRRLRTTRSSSLLISTVSSTSIAMRPGSTSLRSTSHLIFSISRGSRSCAIAKLTPTLGTLRPGRVPGGQRGQRLGQHHLADALGQVGLLGEVEEAPPGEQPVARVAPAHQRLEARQRPGGEVDLRLEERRELAALEARRAARRSGSRGARPRPAGSRGSSGCCRFPPPWPSASAISALASARSGSGRSSPSSVTPIEAPIRRAPPCSEKGLVSAAWTRCAMPVTAWASSSRPATSTKSSWPR